MNGGFILYGLNGEGAASIHIPFSPLNPVAIHSDLGLFLSLGLLNATYGIIGLGAQYS